MKQSCYIFLFLASITLSFGQNFSQVDDILQKNLPVYRNKVCVMVQQQGKPMYYRSIGGYDSLSITAVASVSKTFSGILMLALVDKGLLNLNDSLGKHLPIFTKYGKGSPTIRQLFSHSSGFPGDETSDFLSSRTMTLEEVANTVAETVPFAYQPGSAFAYGGVSMQVAGRIAEVVTGKSWNQAFEEYLGKPLGLSQTSFCLNSASNPRIAGGVCTSPKDIMLLAELILNRGKFQGKQLISAAVMEELWKDQTNKAPQLASPYPDKPRNNNPYAASTIYYGIGTWQDIYNPSTMYQEQISGAGAFGTYFWVDRVRGVTGVVFMSSLSAITTPFTFQLVDAIRTALSVSTSTKETGVQERMGIYPNPARNGQLFARTDKKGAACLVNTKGQIVLRFELSQLNLGLEVYTLPSGVYFLKSAFGIERVVLLPGGD